MNVMQLVSRMTQARVPLTNAYARNPSRITCDTLAQSGVGSARPYSRYVGGDVTELLGTPNRIISTSLRNFSISLRNARSRLDIIVRRTGSNVSVRSFPAPRSLRASRSGLRSAPGSFAVCICGILSLPLSASSAW